MTANLDPNGGDYKLVQIVGANAGVNSDMRNLRFDLSCSLNTKFSRLFVTTLQYRMKKGSLKEGMKTPNDTLLSPQNEVLVKLPSNLKQVLRNSTQCGTKLLEQQQMNVYLK